MSPDPVSPNEPRLFTLLRHADQTGISGTGRVLDGVVFHNGKVVVCWRSDLREDLPGHTSLTVYDSWEGFVAIHVAPHPPEQSEIRYSPQSGFARIDS